MSQDHQNRVRAELSELTQKHELLTTFLTDAPRLKRLNVPEDEQRRLRRQHKIMALYIEVLEERIEAFEPEDMR